MTPGSREAKKRGCLCSDIENNWGNGYWSQTSMEGPVFKVASNCPIHGMAAWAKNVHSQIVYVDFVKPINIVVDRVKPIQTS